MREVVLKKYAGTYTENKRNAIQIKFDEQTDLRSFFKLKLEALSSYTTLSFLNQIEMILLELPNEISKLFLVKQMMTKSKSEILEFCGSIQDMAQSIWQKEEDEETESVHQGKVVDEMETFIFSPDFESENEVTPAAQGITGTGNKEKRKRRHPLISDEVSDATTEIDDSDSSCSESSSGMSFDFSSQTSRSRSGGIKGSKIQGKELKRGRGRPRKSLAAIQEESSDTVTEGLN